MSKNTVTARDVADVFEQIAPLDSGIEGDQLGFLFGDPDREVSGLGCCWNVHTGSIEAAVAQGLDLCWWQEAVWR